VPLEHQFELLDLLWIEHRIAHIAGRVGAAADIFEDGPEDLLRVGIFECPVLEVLAELRELLGVGQLIPRHPSGIVQLLQMFLLYRI